MDNTVFPVLINLIRGVSKVLESELTNAASKLGLSVTELSFIWIIFHEEEPTVSRIAELTLLDASTVTQVLTRLKKKKLVTSYKKATDQRFSYVRLTNKGEEKRTLSMTNDEFIFLTFLQKELEEPGSKEKLKYTIDFLKQINLHFHGEEFVNWTYSLPEKFKKDLK